MNRWAVNVNTILSGLLLALLLGFGSLVFDAYRSTSRMEQQLSTLADKFELYAPRAYTDLKFQAVDAELKSLRAQLQVNEVELQKLRGRR